MYYFGIILFRFFTSAHEDNFHLYPRSRVICKQLLNHGGKLARIHHVVVEFTKCSGCLPSILIVDNCIFVTFRRQVRLCSSSFPPGVHFDFYFGDRHRKNQWPGNGKLKLCFNSSRAREFPD